MALATSPNGSITNQIFQINRCLSGFAIRKTMRRSKRQRKELQPQSAKINLKETPTRKRKLSEPSKLLQEEVTYLRQQNARLEQEVKESDARHRQLCNEYQADIHEFEEQTCQFSLQLAAQSWENEQSEMYALRKEIDSLKSQNNNQQARLDSLEQEKKTFIEDATKCIVCLQSAMGLFRWPYCNHLCCFPCMNQLLLSNHHRMDVWNPTDQSFTPEEAVQRWSNFKKDRLIYLCENKSKLWGSLTFHGDNKAGSISILDQPNVREMKQVTCPSCRMNSLDYWTLLGNWSLWVVPLHSLRLNQVPPEALQPKCWGCTETLEVKHSYEATYSSHLFLTCPRLCFPCPFSSQASECTILLGEYPEVQQTKPYSNGAEYIKQLIRLHLVQCKVKKFCRNCKHDYSPQGLYLHDCQSMRALENIKRRYCQNPYSVPTNWIKKAANSGDYSSSDED